MPGAAVLPSSCAVPNRPVCSQLTGLTARQPQRAPVVVTTSGDQEDDPNTQPLLVGGGGALTLSWAAQ